MHYSVVIISNNPYNYSNTYNLNVKVTLLDDCNLILDDLHISFDYLIYTDISLVENQKEIGILTEHKIPITNYDKQTSVENIYYCDEYMIKDVLEIIFS